MPEHRLSLRRQLLWQLWPLMLLLFLLGGLGAYRLARGYSVHVYDSWLYDSAKSLTAVVHRGGEVAEVDFPDSLRKLFLWDEADTTYFEILGEHSGRMAGNTIIPPPPPEARHYESGRLYDGIIGQESVRIVELRLPSSLYNEAVTIKVAETRHKRKALQKELLVQLLMVLTILLTAASLVLWRGVSRALQPLEDIVRQLDLHEQQGPQSLPEDTAVPREVRPLADALNTVVARLDRSLAAQRRFVANAAHQLRTPLAGLLLHIDEAQQQTDPAKIQEILAHLRISAERAVRLSNQLLALSRASPEAVALQTFGPVELCALARDVGAEWVPRALEKELDISFHCDQERVEVRGNPTLLREAINNLVDNAIKYHPGKGVVTLSVDAKPRPQLTVDDDGPGIPESEREKVTRRFFRAEQSRSGGAGLGLAIVKDIAQAHRAEFTIGTGSSGKGTRVRLSFPPCPPGPPNSPD